jgi:phage tail protein X
LTATDLFNHVYATGDRLVLQTCIANHGQASWGRLFIIAQPVTHHTLPIASYQPIPAYHATSFVAMAH